MLWFFERATEIVELETRYDNDNAQYLLELRIPDEPPKIERFDDAMAFRVRLQAIEESLRGQRWMRKGPPSLLADGWPNVTPPR